MGNQSAYRKMVVKLLRATAGLMPRDLVYFVLIRVQHEVTAEQWPGDGPDTELTMSQAIGRWYALGMWPKNLREYEKGRKKGD